MVNHAGDNAELGTCSEMYPHVLDGVDVPVNRSEVLRYLGYPADTTPSHRIEKILDRWIAEAEQRATPRAVYAIFPVVECGKRMLRMKTNRGITELRGAIGEFLGVSHRVAAFIATAGPGVEQLASELMRRGDDLAALIVGSVGAKRAEAAEYAAIGQLRHQAAAVGLAPTLPYSPGYCGMAITEQSRLFALFEQETVGVTLSEDYLMNPLKSVSGLVGLGLPDEIRQYGSHCDRCDLRKCKMRR